jgi:hypothetical protein
MSQKINAESFAQAVVSSSNETDINKLLDLYVNAISAANDYNSSLPIPKGKVGKYPRWFLIFSNRTIKLCNGRYHFRAFVI